MKADTIRVGDILRLKKDNPYGLGPLLIRVTELRTRGHYKTPWVIDERAHAYKPSDFSNRHEPWEESA